MTSPARVAVVEDHPLIRDGIVAAIQSSPRLRFAGSADSVVSGLDLLDSTEPDIVVVDHHLPDGTGLEVLRHTTSLNPTAASLVLTAFDDDEVLFESLSLGARGFVLKSSTSSVLVDALERVSEGNSFIDPSITGRVFDRIRRPTTEVDQRIGSLNPMERRVLELLTRGLTNKQIAPIIMVSDTTVKNYVSGILRKLGLNRRTEAAVYALSSTELAPSPRRTGRVGEVAMLQGGQHGQG